MATSYPSTILISFPFEESGPDYGVIRTEMEMGYVQTRNRTTIAPRSYKFTHVAASGNDVATWLAHWNDRKGGGASFTFTDPRTSSTITVRFKQQQPMIRRTGPITYDIDVELEEADRKSTRLNSSHVSESRMPSSA